MDAVKLLVGATDSKPLLLDENIAAEQGKNEYERDRVPECEPRAQRQRLHDSSSASWYPSPRRVRISAGSPTASSFRRRR